MSLDWYYVIGKPYTLYNFIFKFSPLDRDTEEVYLIPIAVGYNDLRLPNTHKLSFSFSSFWNWGDVHSDLSLGIQNAYNRNNVIYQYELDGEGIQQ